MKDTEIISEDKVGDVVTYTSDGQRTLHGNVKEGFEYGVSVGSELTICKKTTPEDVFKIPLYSKNPPIIFHESSEVVISREEYNKLKQTSLDNPEQTTYNESSAVALLKEIAMSNMTKEQIKKKAKEFLWPGSVVYKH